MGVRTFLESEVAKTKLRKDLLEKMMKLDPNEPTEEERLNGITKLRCGPAFHFTVELEVENDVGTGT